MNDWWSRRCAKRAQERTFLRPSLTIHKLILRWRMPYKFKTTHNSWQNSKVTLICFLFPVRDPVPFINKYRTRHIFFNRLYILAGKVRTRFGYYPMSTLSTQGGPTARGTCIFYWVMHTNWTKSSIGPPTAQRSKEPRAPVTPWSGQIVWLSPPVK